MKEFIMNNLPVIITIVAVLVIALIFCFVGKGKYKKKVKQMLLALVVEAEEKYGSGTGEIKFAYVAEKIYAIMPSFLQIFISAQTIGLWIDEAVVKMKEYLAENAQAASIVCPTTTKKKLHS